MTDRVILGRKLGMSQVFVEDGGLVPVTVIEAGPCVVLGLRSVARDGYNAVNLGFEIVPAERLIKPRRGQFKGDISPRKVVREIRIDSPETFEVGQELTASIFRPGERVDVSGVSKGRGMAGTIKRHNFRSGPGGHGSNNHRLPGSIGQSADPSKVFKGMRMAGRMGGKTTTVLNLNVVKIVEEDNLLLIKGAVPGRKGTLLTIRHSSRDLKKVVN